MTRMANTLMHVPDLHWIIVEDRNQTNPSVEALLARSRIPHSYLAYRTIKPFPARGWYQRNMAMQYVRKNTKKVLNGHKEGMLYFGDDDNSYDVRLFDDYIRKVRKIGCWPVGLVGGALVEAPIGENGKLVGFHVKFLPNRPFPIDMAGFAIHLNFILNTTAGFDPDCQKQLKAPETCFLEGVGFTRNDLEPFDSQRKKDKEILVWHTKPRVPRYNITSLGRFEAAFEEKVNEKKDESQEKAE